MIHANSISLSSSNIPPPFLLEIVTEESSSEQSNSIKESNDVIGKMLFEFKKA